MRSARSFSIVLVTAGDSSNALKLARGLVRNRLAACVNLVSPVRSIYRWKGKIRDDREILLVIKTRTKNVPKVERWVHAAHTYEVPEIITLGLKTGSSGYLAWLAQETQPRERKVQWQK